MSSMALQPIVYQADSTHVQAIRTVKERLVSAIGSIMYRPVRIHTADGRVFEGSIVQVDDTYVYLHTPAGPAQDRAFFGPAYYGGFLLPLVLYDLLVISLLYG